LKLFNLRMPIYCEIYLELYEFNESQSTPIDLNDPKEFQKLICARKSRNFKSALEIMSSFN